jgi:hypothetical protein
MLSAQSKSRRRVKHGLQISGTLPKRLRLAGGQNRGGVRHLRQPRRGDAQVQPVRGDGTGAGGGYVPGVRDAGRDEKRRGKRRMIKERSKVIRRYKAGYEVREEVWKTDENDSGTNMKTAYTLSGDWIGDPKWARRLCVIDRIKPEKAKPEHCVCSIGFCEIEQRWYGWSHRAIAGFGIGDEVKEGDCCASSGWTEEYLKEHPEEDLSLPVGFVAKTLDDCKRMAIAFAESVS